MQSQTRSKDRWSGLRLLLLLVLALLLPACGGGGGGGSAAGEVSGRVIFSGTPSAQTHADPRAFVHGKALACMVRGEMAQAQRELDALECHVVERNPGGACVIAFDLPAGLSADARAAATLARIEALDTASSWQYAEPNYRRTIRKRPNDTRYNEQWHYPLMELESAWDITTGSDQIIVAVLDTGETNHPDMAGRLTSGYDFVSDTSISGDGDGRDGDPTDVGDSEGDGEPSSFHGTHVAGTIGAASDNGVGVSGVTWQTQIMHLRVLGIGGGEDADIIAAIRYAARLSNASGQLPAKRANIINMSLGGGGFSQSMQNAITAARAEGVVIFAAAGNSGNRALEYPASFDGVVSVAAVDRQGAQASYSNRNGRVDLAAPGGDTFTGQSDGVLSTLYDDSSGTARATFAFYDGTSMATPHAAGVAALILAVDPTLTPAQVENILFTSATDKGSTGRDNRYGHGLINAYAAVLQARDGAPDLPLLQLATGSVSFTDGTAQQDVAITNAGTQQLVVDRVTPRTTTGSAWLQAATYGSGDASRSVDGVRITATPTALSDGMYAGSVEVVSNGGTQTIGVSLQVGSGGGADEIYVLLIDWDTEATMAEAIVSAGSDGTFTLTGLPAGRYYLFAGSDQDGDGFICDPGDWCGVYGDENDPTLLTVDGVSPVTDIEIRLVRDAGGAAGKPRPARLRP